MLGFFLLEEYLRNCLWHLQLRSEDYLRVATRRRDHNRSPELRPGFAEAPGNISSKPQRAMEAAQKNTSKTNRRFSLKGESCLTVKTRDEKGEGLPKTYILRI